MSKRRRATGALAASAFKEVQIGPLWWKICRVNTLDLLHQGGKTLLTLPPATPQAAPVVRMDKEEIAFGDAVIIAGLRAIAAPAVEGESLDWEPITLVRTEAEADPDAGKIWIGTLPLDHRKELTGEILLLSTDGGAASRRIAAFLGGGEDHAGCPGETVRDGSLEGGPMVAVPPDARV